MTRADRRRNQSTEAERCVLGALLLQPALWADVEGCLDVSDFGAERHARLFEWLTSRHADGKDADIVAATCDVDCEPFGGGAYVSSLPERVVSLEALPRYVETVRRQAMRDRVVAAADAIREAAEQEEDPGEALALAERRLQVLAGSSAPQDFYPASVIMEEQWKAYGDRSERRMRGACAGLSTGYSDLDNIIGGMRPTELIIIAARPAVGKTSLALNIARNVTKGGVGVALCSQEMSRGQCLDRMLAAEARISAEALRDGVHRDERAVWDRMIDGVEELNRRPLWVSDAAGMQVASLASKARRLKAANPHLGLLIVDYLQIMGVEDKRAGREDQVARIATGLKRIAMELDIPLIAVAQLNRGVEARANKRPTMADLRESGQIEQDADVIAFLYRDDYYNSESQAAGQCEVNVEKNRNGRTGQAVLSWSPVWQRFDALASYR